jgi:protein-ribulosamine 3-kinase
MNWQHISEQIEITTGLPFAISNAQPLSGGDINSAFKLEGNDKAYFVKLNRPDSLAMFAAESAGLLELADTKTVRIPSPVVHGQSPGQAFLALEYIEFGVTNKMSERLFGQQLAMLHQQAKPYYGWRMDNTIGSTPQLNTPSHDWPEYYRNQRLQYQLNMAAANGFTGRLQATGAQLCENIANFFNGYNPQPSLLHGDLWSGNAATDSAGNPVIYDPACYYGDRETDIAMTELFGGFGRDFYAAYQEISPLDQGYTIRKTLYNLYHILNHLNLFGGGYLRQAENMISSLLSEIR